jgi:hypothetical protein
MGNWNISINGIGQHHNSDKEHDADELAKKLVLDLIEAGQSVSSATFTNGSADDMTPKKDAE